MDRVERICDNCKVDKPSLSHVTNSRGRIYGFVCDDCYTEVDGLCTKIAQLHGAVFEGSCRISPKGTPDYKTIDEAREYLANC